MIRFWFQTSAGVHFIILFIEIDYENLQSAVTNQNPYEQRPTSIAEEASLATFVSRLGGPALQEPHQKADAEPGGAGGKKRVFVALDVRHAGDIDVGPGQLG